MTMSSGVSVRGGPWRNGEGHARSLAIALLLGSLTMAPALAQNAQIAGHWQTREGTPSRPNIMGEIGASDVQAMELTLDGHYRRDITVEGGNGFGGASGTIVDQGLYGFTAPDTFAYNRRSYTMCTAFTCAPYPPPPPNQGRLPFQPIDASHAKFLGLIWTRVR